MHVIIPALNEEAAISGVVCSLVEAGFGNIIVVDNGSSDRTAEIARRDGACVVREPRKGYGAACLAGIAAVKCDGVDDVVAFIDADGSDDVADLRTLILALLNDAADLVIGSRTLGRRTRGAQPAHARFGTWLACRLMYLRTGRSYTDLGPMRALRYSTLQALAMKDRDFGWTVEMQLKAAHTLRVVELPVNYRPRIGHSKISGTVSGSARAGSKILWTIATYGR